MDFRRERKNEHWQVRGEIEVKRDAVIKSIKDAKTAVAAVVALASDPVEAQCNDTASRQAVLQLFAISSQLTNYIDANTKLIAALDDVVKMLKDFEGKTWRNNDMDLIFGTAATDPKLIKEQALTFTRLEYKKSDEGIRVEPIKVTEQSRKFSIRRHRRLVPEVGVAAVYNELEYPKYTAAGDAGAFKIKKETDDGNIDAAMTLNFLCNCIGDDTIYPGIQFGVSKADKYPGFLLGLTLRLAGEKHIAIGAGGILSFYKDLKTLHDGDPVTNQEQIEKDLHRRSATSWYFAVQYNF